MNLAALFVAAFLRSFAYLLVRLGADSSKVYYLLLLALSILPPFVFLLRLFIMYYEKKPRMVLARLVTRLFILVSLVGRGWRN